MNCYYSINRNIQWVTVLRVDRLDLNLLAALDVLIETQSVTETARQLNLSQPTVSAALARLRHYFGDDLLQQIGRRMVVTQKARELSPAIKEMLAIVKFCIAHADEFDPASSTRRFTLVASDYAFDVFLAEVLRKAECLAPGVVFEIASPGPQRVRQFRDGDIDLLITVSDYLVEDHPHELLYTDEDAAICWDQGIFADGINAEQFLAASHAVAVFGQEQMPTVTELHYAATGIARHIAVRVPSFAALPRAVIGTNRVATLHRRHAEMFAQHLPIQIHPLPIRGPLIDEIMQWHRQRQTDAGLRWLLSLLRQEGQRMTSCT